MKRWIARKLLSLFGWRIEGGAPQQQQFVLIAAPHTSNWDFPLMLLFAASFNIKVYWMGKSSLFFPPVGWIMRFLGGVPIRRERANNVVGSMVQAFAENPHLVLVVPTEGKRARAEYWKSGFYHIARGAGVAIVPSYLDYGARRGGFGPALLVSGDVSSDMQYFRDFYAPMQGLFPERFGPVRLRDETTEP
ncbi:MAG: lysophospholipid acyltransferase family protein [Halieaceae bacterium]